MTHRRMNVTIAGRLYIARPTPFGIELTEHPQQPRPDAQPIAQAEPALGATPRHHAPRLAPPFTRRYNP